MGRPLHKKYFGNTNAPYGYGATGPGGQGVASATVQVKGSYVSSTPTFTFSAPDLVGGVTATGTVTSEAQGATVGGTQTVAYQVGQTIAVGDNGATFTVATLAPAAAALSNVAITGTGGQISFDALVSAIPVGTSITIAGTFTNVGTTAGSITGYANPTTYFVKASTTSTATLVSTYIGAITGAGGGIVTVAGDTVGLTFTPGNTAGPVATVTPANRGVYTDLVTGIQTTTTTNGGAGATLTLSYRALAAVITNPGSGYTTPPTVASYANRGGITISSPVLTTTQFHGILAYAYTGSSREVINIMKQQSGRRYKIRGATPAAGENYTVHSAILVAKQSSAVGEMDITATDSSGNEYWVMKITSHRATIIRKNPALGEFASDTAVHWTLGVPTLNETVQIASA